ncbi:transporter substrate-binding domain-containing protein [Curvibacter sp. APW13]|uniref:substrate-binding periplasmic protein n=1 Tax=Curvibacter sp. APW13 TaxID=3077236 RepID=UPI0028DF1815|nr:transporter substrate-binding domain-containing protein [Curvibacter sp. APW13]MDT8989445.1 transporter substrate-binding domain-containing protein [Curvibacter sp. APW13]
MAIRTVLMLLAGFLTSLAAQAECDKLVLTADPSYPPMHWYDGTQFHGASVTIAKRVLDELKIPYEVRYLGPFPRVVNAAEQGDVDMVVTLKKTPEREQFLLYPRTAALANPVAVFASRERMFKFKDRTDLVGRRGGITRGNVFGDDFDEFLRHHLSIEEADSPENNFSKLGAARIDYFITGYYAGMAYLLKRGDEMRFTALSPFVVDTPNYLALTRKGRCADKLDAIDAKLAQLKKSGVVEELIRQAFAQWKQNPVVAVK